MVKCHKKINVSLPLECIEFLKTVGNRSRFIAKLIEDAMRTRTIKKHYGVILTEEEKKEIQFLIQNDTPEEKD